MNPRQHHSEMEILHPSEDLEFDYPIPIPAQSSAVWHRLRRRTYLTANPGLIFDRYSPDLSQVEDVRNLGKARLRGWIEVMKAAHHVDEELFGALRQRWLAGLQAAGGTSFKLSTVWRLVTGIGEKGPLEVGFAFDRYGFPTLPGSSVKGIARGRYLAHLAEANGASMSAWESALLTPGDKAFQSALKKLAVQPGTPLHHAALVFRLLFGRQDAAGAVVFWDAIPGEIPRLEIDVINPHYPRYYQNGEAPANWQSPVPVYFLTVGANTTYWFGIAPRQGFNPGAVADEKLREVDWVGQAAHWLKAGLMDSGAGAKTNAGYGHFTEPPQCAS